MSDLPGERVKHFLTPVAVHRTEREREDEVEYKGNRGRVCEINTERIGVAQQFK
jgi:hypothetical protein